EACPQGLAERREIGIQPEALLAASGRIAEAGNYLVENEQCAVAVREIANRLQVAIPRENATHVGHDGLGNDSGQLRSFTRQDCLQRRQVVPGSEHYVVECRLRDSPGIWDPLRIFFWPERGGRMSVRVQQIRIVPAVIMAFELEEFV